MMTDTTARFALPLLAPGQAQKEMFHNEALALIDAALHPCVMAAGVDVPPGSPTEGQCWLVGDAPDAAWTGHADALAIWTGGGWRFVAPREGMTVWDAATGRLLRRIGGAWRMGPVHVESLVVGGHAMLSSPQAGIADPAGGATVDATARTAINAILQALRHHGLIVD